MTLRFTRCVFVEASSDLHRLKRRYTATGALVSNIADSLRHLRAAISCLGRIAPQRQQQLAASPVPQTPNYNLRSTSEGHTAWEQPRAGSASVRHCKTCVSHGCTKHAGSFRECHLFLEIRLLRRIPSLPLSSQALCHCHPRFILGYRGLGTSLLPHSLPPPQAEMLRPGPAPRSSLRYLDYTRQRESNKASAGMTVHSRLRNSLPQSDQSHLQPP
jgi:hypothetical protein